MTNKNKIILGLTVVVVIIGVIAFWPKKVNKEVVTDTRVIIPEMVTTNYKSDTGAKDISLTEVQYDEIYLIKDLRNKMPINRDYFIADYDYNVNKFIIKYKDTKKGREEFEKWLMDTGYNQISIKYFQIK
jgi:hypothetical protein